MNILQDTIIINLILETILLLQYTGIIFFTTRANINGVKPFLTLVFSGQFSYHLYQGLVLLALLIMDKSLIANDMFFDAVTIFMAAALVIRLVNVILNTSLHMKLIDEARKLNDYTE